VVWLIKDYPTYLALTQHYRWSYARVVECNPNNKDTHELLDAWIRNNYGHSRQDKEYAKKLKLLEPFMDSHSEFLNMTAEYSTRGHTLESKLNLILSIVYIFIMVRIVLSRYIARNKLTSFHCSWCNE
jgi:hypothetical protein